VLSLRLVRRQSMLSRQLDWLEGVRAKGGQTYENGWFTEGETRNWNNSDRHLQGETIKRGGDKKKGGAGEKEIYLACAMQRATLNGRGLRALRTGEDQGGVQCNKKKMGKKGKRPRNSGKPASGRLGWGTCTTRMEFLGNLTVYKIITGGSKNSRRVKEDTQPGLRMVHDQCGESATKRVRANYAAKRKREGGYGM